MNGPILGDFFWEKKFEELADFNACRNRNRYSKEYIFQMDQLQKEYNKRLVDFAEARGHIVAK